MSGARRSRIGSAVGALDPRLRARLALGAGVLALATFAACGACARRAPEDTAAATSPEDLPRPPAEDAAALRPAVLWASAKAGEAEDLATLAAHEGAAGLVEAAAEPELRSTALRAMAYARGWAHVPFLARTGAGKDDEEARVALDTIVELANRVRTAEEPEDADELQEGCEALGRLAADRARPRARRVSAVRALRLLPCPPGGEALPSDLDAK